MKIFVGNLPFSTDADGLRTLFEGYGAVADAKIIMDRENPERSRGFGFVEMVDAGAAQHAIATLHGMDFEGRELTVNVARERKKLR